MSKYRQANPGAHDPADLFKNLGRMRSKEEAFRHYDEHVNDKVLVGLKKLSSLLLK